MKKYLSFVVCISMFLLVPSTHARVLSDLYIEDDRYEMVQYVMPDVLLEDIKECVGYAELSIKYEDQIPLEVREASGLYPLFELWSQIQVRHLTGEIYEGSILSSGVIKPISNDHLSSLFLSGDSQSDKLKKCGEFGGNILNKISFTYPKSEFFDKLVDELQSVSYARKASCSAIYFSLKLKEYKYNFPFRAWMKSLNDVAIKNLNDVKNAAENDVYWEALKSGNLTDIDLVDGYSRKLEFCQGEFLSAFNIVTSDITGVENQ